MTDANRLVLFDCDGTLVDGQHMIVEAMKRTFEVAGLAPAAPGDVRAIIGLSLSEAMAQLLPGAEPALHSEIAALYKNSFASMRADGSFEHEPLYEGTLAALKALDSAGYHLGVATGKSQRGLNFVLEHHGIRDMFVTLQTADFHPSKPHPSMALTAMAEAGAAAETTIMVGDTSYDMMMGDAAGTHLIGVTWGYHQRDELQASGAGRLAETFADLPSLVGQIFEGARHG